MNFTGGSYDGQTAGGRFDGHGTYTFPDGSKYVGQFKAGMFHGKGTIVNDVGSYAGVWEYGKELSGEFSFKDGLVYKKEGWSYCTPQDRRFYTESLDGIKPAGECQLTNAAETPKVPKGCFDAGDGYYDPERGRVYEYGSTDKEIRRAGTMESKWAVAKCRVGTEEESKSATE